MSSCALKNCHPERSRGIQVLLVCHSRPSSAFRLPVWKRATRRISSRAQLGSGGSAGASAPRIARSSKWASAPAPNGIQRQRYPRLNPCKNYPQPPIALMIPKYLQRLARFLLPNYCELNRVIRRPHLASLRPHTRRRSSQRLLAVTPFERRLPYDR